MTLKQYCDMQDCSNEAIWLDYMDDPVCEDQRIQMMGEDEDLSETDFQGINE